MKFTVNVECSPEEARRFMGLPDVTPINDKLVEEMGKRMEANLKMMSGGDMMQSWMSVGTQAQDAFVKLMTSAATGAAPREKP
jgi:fructosamine-3-kinase